MSIPTIEIENLSFSYPQLQVLNDINLTLHNDEFLGIVGPNGGGKSTLLKLILGLLKPDKGSIRVLGQAPKAARPMLGYVPQFATFDSKFPIRVKDTVLQGRFGTRRHQLFYSREDHLKTTEAMERTDILDLQDRPMTALSGGQRQRVLIARALACDPKLLLLDEPTANIDPYHGENIFGLLHRLHDEVSIVLISHDIGFITRCVTRVACLNHSLVCHATSPVENDLLQQIYGMPLSRVEHETNIDSGGHI
ncbi:MAG: ABC transporter ATP-binding protein [Desulfuromonadaceae bacterium]|nr:ABC transporter ATP-binding protein [Desulfuromonadaceae bacterium]